MISVNLAFSKMLYLILSKSSCLLKETAKLTKIHHFIEVMDSAVIILLAFQGV